MKVTKVVKIQIVKPINCDWDLFGKILNEIQYETRQVLNKSTTFAWEWEGFSSDYKLKYGEYPKQKDVLNYTNVMGYAYDKLKNIHTKLNTGNLSQTIKRATDKFKNDKLDILKGNKSPSIYTKNQPIDIKSKMIQLTKEDDKYYANLSLISTKYRKELNMKSGQFKVLLGINDNSTKTIVNKILTEEYKLCSSQIIKIKKGKTKWMLYLTFKFDQKDKQLDKNRILGVDLGVVNVATLQIYDQEKQKYDWLKYNQCIIDGMELIKYRQRTEAKRISLQKQAKHCGEGRVGHGYNTRMKPLNNIRNKIHNFRSTYNHKISRYIVNFAISNNCGVIQMENLSGFSIKQKNSMLKNWSYYDLQSKIQNKASEHGIIVNYIEPKYTSKRCYKCGCIDDKNRDIKKDQSKFKCMSCGHTDNADINAARNIAIPEIEKIINNTLKNKSAS